MSTIKVENIRIASEAVSRPVTGVSAAWATPSSSGVLDWDSLNISSATDEGTGDIGFNFNSNMSNATYSVTMTVVTTTSKLATLGSPSTTTFYLRTFDTTGSAANARTTAQVFGELA